jgi:hypothetical protein
VDIGQARGSETVCRMDPTAAQRAALAKITAEIAAAAGPALPGTLTVRTYACGKPNCRCHADPPRLHGPYAEWTRKIGGTTITRRLTPRELAEYRALVRQRQETPRPAHRTPGPHPRDRRDRQPPAAAKPGTGDPWSGKRELSSLNLRVTLPPNSICPAQP